MNKFKETIFAKFNLSDDDESMINFDLLEKMYTRTEAEALEDEKRIKE